MPGCTGHGGRGGGRRSEANTGSCPGSVGWPDTPQHRGLGSVWQNLLPGVRGRTSPPPSSSPIDGEELTGAVPRRVQGEVLPGVWGCPPVSFLCAPKSGGSGVEMTMQRQLRWAQPTLHDGGGGSRSALSTLYLDSRLRGNDRDDAVRLRRTVIWGVPRSSCSAPKIGGLIAAPMEPLAYHDRKEGQHAQ